MKKIITLLFATLVFMTVVCLPSLASAATMYVDGNLGPNNTVRIRSAASTGSSILINVTYGTALQATSYNNSWHSVSYTDPVTKKVYNGYMDSSYLSSSIPTDCLWIARYGTRAHQLTNTKYPGADYLQHDLNSYFRTNGGSSYSWYPLAEDGYCGANTVSAIKKFQSLEGLTSDGIAGNRTKEYLYKIVKPY